MGPQAQVNIHFAGTINNSLWGFYRTQPFKYGSQTVNQGNQLFSTQFEASKRRFRWDMAFVSLGSASLMLCLDSILSGDVHSGSWRVHAEGAKALLASVRRSQSQRTAGTSAELEAIIRFSSRWHLSVESLDAITSSGLAAGQCVVQDVGLGIITEPTELSLDACDDHFGYPARFALLLREIGASAW
ncbi:hypothetical protein NM208_g3053 [Fusarium decemcellulare]|uniref:Uncharacterized protein n=1 Tax=Fusarium decemcellulare TaxID=57161 RepID=A0ACC1SQK3_9HYPO|nr:hypothetical protein NM208_g3053 [Fusarium decemcellulare]